jgi:hypothetical protein
LNKMKLLQELRELKETIEKCGRYVGAVSARESIANFYKESWLPISEDFKSKFGSKNADIIEANARAMYDLSKSAKPWRKSLLGYINEIEQVLDQLELDVIRHQGSVIEINAKDEIISVLESKGFIDTTNYIRKAEAEYSGKNDKECCIQARLAIEEFFRNLRERDSGKITPRGTLGDHMDYLEKQAKIVNFSERQLIQRGFYAFLSEKGNHATKDTPTPEDSKLSLYILYILIEYCLEKFL